MTVDEYSLVSLFPDELRVNSFPDGFPHSIGSIVSPLQLLGAKGVSVFN